jgi:predicted nucleotidyltransferase
MGESLDRELIDTITQTLRAAYPEVDGIYLYGSAAQGALSRHSDVDIAVVLPHEAAKGAGPLALSKARFQLEQALGRPVDLLNARIGPIVLQKEVVATGACVFARDHRRIEEYEMLVLSLYGKLNEERRGILDEFQATGRAYPV